MITKIHDPYNIREDPKMYFLSKALDPNYVTLLLSDMMSKVCDILPVSNICLSNINVLRYKPTKRCLIEYIIKYNNKNDKSVFIKLLGKTSNHGTGLTTYKLAKYLWNSGFDSQSNDLVSIPQPIGTIPEIKMWFQTKILGKSPIESINLKGQESIKLFQRIAFAIHKIHKKNILVDKRKHTLNDEMRILEKRLSLVSEENPQWKYRLEDILNGCYNISKYLSYPKKTSIHRDFYHDQIMVDNRDRIYILDLDLYCEGDPAIDIGNFKAHLDELFIRNENELSLFFSNLGKILVDQYLLLSNLSNRLSINIYEILSLVRHISISREFPDRLNSTEKLISVCKKKIDLLIEDQINK